jgi:ribosomal-protein-alanine N-acetyltransferase
MKLQNFGADKLFLEVRESNQKARNFYESLNASLVGRRVKYYKDGESAAIYRIDF